MTIVKIISIPKSHWEISLRELQKISQQNLQGQQIFDIDRGFRFIEMSAIMKKDYKMYAVPKVIRK